MKPKLRKWTPPATLIKIYYGCGHPRTYKDGHKGTEYKPYMIRNVRIYERDIPYIEVVHMLYRTFGVEVPEGFLAQLKKDYEKAQQRVLDDLPSEVPWDKLEEQRLVTQYRPEHDREMGQLRKIFSRIAWADWVTYPEEIQKELKRWLIHGSLAAERRLRFHGFRWASYVGFDPITRKLKKGYGGGDPRSLFKHKKWPNYKTSFAYAARKRGLKF